MVQRNSTFVTGSLLERAKIFNRHLKLKWNRPRTFFYACFFPFMQAITAAAITVFVSAENSILNAVGLFVSGIAYYACFVANAKRSANGSKLGILLLLLFGSLGLVCGKLLFK